MLILSSTVYFSVKTTADLGDKMIVVMGCQAPINPRSLLQFRLKKSLFICHKLSKYTEKNASYFF